MSLRVKIWSAGRQRAVQVDDRRLAGISRQKQGPVLRSVQAADVRYPQRAAGYSSPLQRRRRDSHAFSHGSRRCRFVRLSPLSDHRFRSLLDCHFGQIRVTARLRSTVRRHRALYAMPPAVRSPPPPPPACYSAAGVGADRGRSRSRSCPRLAVDDVESMVSDVDDLPRRSRRPKATRPRATG